MVINSKCTQWWTMPNGSKLVFVEPGQSTAETVHHISAYLKAVDDVIKRFKSNMSLFQLGPVPWGSLPSSNWTGCMLPTPFTSPTARYPGLPRNPGKYISGLGPSCRVPQATWPITQKLGSVMFELGLMWSWYWGVVCKWHMCFWWTWSLDCKFLLVLRKKDQKWKWEEPGVRSLSTGTKDAQLCLKENDAVRVFCLHLRFTYRVSLNVDK